MAGATVTITASITQDDLAVTDAMVAAVVAHPDGATTTQVALDHDGPAGAVAAGDGHYTGSFTATTQAGLYAVVVSAERADPAFTRQQLLQFTVAQSATTFSGAISDRGVDTDGDGRFDQLVVDVGLEVDVEAAYRVVRHPQRRGRDGHRAAAGGAAAARLAPRRWRWPSTAQPCSPSATTAPSCSRTWCSRRSPP